MDDLHKLLDVFSGGNYTRSIKRVKVLRKSREVFRKRSEVSCKFIAVGRKRVKVLEKCREVKDKRIEISHMRGMVAIRRKDIAQKRTGIVLKLYSENQDLKAISSITQLSVAKVKTILAEKEG